VAEVGGAPKAGLGGYDPTVAGNTALLQALPEVFQRLRDGSSGLSEDGDPPRILTCIPEPIEGAWMIDSVASVPEFRRLGVVSTLLDAVMKKGRDKGFRKAQVNIYIGNTPAQRLYEKHGFAILDEMRNPYFEAETGSPGMARMLKDL
jgi:ribosomal protein S18 acetylase RimI-like enzyme